ncbi:MAG: nucleotidyl transferase AbiEii/AbiGii toxin family protein [candidate division KSB1 bacterium]|nr:nucleotidyl transferase AbiEii/AbiGii toxin family protein [candidate division KSB1 bacterium]MDZ7365034.1 nucleotidyl transferase AbiEii/AbiGii toxin family protein [candidate division KSB1 bacterium]MDZ7403429.1 nucleotidyl transferase AbiEii/AbiGii toxin family protein [candidate division KSB1 bacterium]
MEDQFEDFIKVLEAFEKYEVDYILIGGVAVILHGMQRLTRDVDVFVKFIPENIGKLRKALHSIYNDPSIEEITLSELNDYPVIRYGTPNGFYIDIMARLGEVATYESLKYEVIDYNGIKIKIATPETLYELKRDTLRDKDKIDAVFLRELIEANKASLPNEE